MQYNPSETVTETVTEAYSNCTSTGRAGDAARRARRAVDARPDGRRELPAARDSPNGDAARPAQAHHPQGQRGERCVLRRQSHAARCVSE